MVVGGVLLERLAVRSLEHHLRHERFIALTIVNVEMNMWTTPCARYIGNESIGNEL